PSSGVDLNKETARLESFAAPIRPSSCLPSRPSKSRSRSGGKFVRVGSLSGASSPEYPTNTCHSATPLGGFDLYEDLVLTPSSLVANPAASEFVVDFPDVNVTPEYPTNTVCFTAPSIGAYATKKPGLPSHGILPSPVYHEVPPLDGAQDTSSSVGSVGTLACSAHPEYPTNTCLFAPQLVGFDSNQDPLWATKVTQPCSVVAISEFPDVIDKPEYPTNTLCIRAPSTGAYATQTPSLPMCHVVTLPNKGEPLSEARQVSQTLEFRPLPTLSLNTHKRDGSGEILEECCTESLTVIKNVAFVEVERSLLSLKDFDFAPSIALTHAQLFSHLVTKSVLVASSGDKPLLDPDFDWIIDSGCTTHMCKNLNLLKDICSMQSRITAAGPDAAVTGIGTACLRAELEDEVTIFTLHNTLLVPSLPINLIFQSKLEGTSNVLCRVKIVTSSSNSALRHA